ncbi:flagellar biosynthesis protein FlgA [SAR202 cluster bacterium AD-804-J14_MRT_500m]|nr:flagellar biosynthesis protein FlgA [SAR202 cluster bacterium AD-804-J14_MRT_500m]
MLNLNSRLANLEQNGAPIKVAFIGAGRFSTMMMAQIARMKGVRVALIADLSRGRVDEAILRSDLDGRPKVYTDSLESADQAMASGRLVVTQDAMLAVRSSVDVVVEATGLVEPGVLHAYNAIVSGKHVVMVNVEADVLVGPYLKNLADQMGVVYSLAYGDQPALIKELYDWATGLGFQVVAAGKGTKYSPNLRKSTPDTVWTLYGHTEDEVLRGDLNPKMYNSFLDGTKSAIEMVAVSNMTGLVPDVPGMHFPPVSIPDIPSVLCPKIDGGILSQTGIVEAISSTSYDGNPIAEGLRWGVYVVVASDSEYLRNAMAEYGIAMGGDGKYGLMYRPYHFVGMEASISIVSAAIMGEPTGAPLGHQISEVVTTAKRPLYRGELVDGEGGYTVYGLAHTAIDASNRGLLPIGLSGGAKLIRQVPEDALITYDDVDLPSESFALKIRRLQDSSFL